MTETIVSSNTNISRRLYPGRRLEVEGLKQKRPNKMGLLISFYYRIRFNGLSKV